MLVELVRRAIRLIDLEFLLLAAPVEVGEGPAFIARGCWTMTADLGRKDPVKARDRVDAFTAVRRRSDLVVRARFALGDPGIPRSGIPADPHDVVFVLIARHDTVVGHEFARCRSEQHRHRKEHPARSVHEVPLLQFHECHFTHLSPEMGKTMLVEFVWVPSGHVNVVGSMPLPAGVLSAHTNTEAAIEPIDEMHMRSPRHPDE